MNKLRWFVLPLVILVLIGMAAWDYSNRAKASNQFQGPARIEPSLQIVLNQVGKANVFVEFVTQVSFSNVQKMEWNARGMYVYDALRKDADRAQAQVREFLSERKIPFRSYIINNTIYIPNANQALIDELTKFSGIIRFYLEEVFPVPITYPSLPDVSIQTVEWGVNIINADDAWVLGYRGQNLVVANIDTGVRYTHTALKNQYRGNNGDGTFTHTYSWYDPTGTYTSAPGDNNGHGTHTMGTMVGDDGGSNQIGVAPGAKWIACKGCSSSSCSSSHLLACFDWMLAPGGDSSKRPNVVNNSWGSCSYSDTYKSAINNLRASGIHPVFSAGNTSNCGYSSAFCGSIGSPGTYKEVTAVGATTSSDTIASFSLWGPSTDPSAPNEIKPKVSAPGASIRSSYNSSDTSYSTMSGTSMAAPHVSGALAVIWSACPAYIGDFEGTEQLLKNTAAKFAYATGCGNEGGGNIPNNAFGYGRIDVLAAINACVGGTPPTPTPTFTPAPTVTPTPAPTTAMHIGDLDNSSINITRVKWSARVTILVHDTNHNVVSGAKVSGNWSNGATGTGSCTTDSTGKCTITKNVSSSTPSVVFTVTNVTKTGMTYSSSSNHDPDSDSDGTKITLYKPN